jgi:hypothetical protein
MIMGSHHAVRILGEVGLQTAIAVGARRSVGGSLALRGHLGLPADDKRYLSKGGQVAGTSENSTPYYAEADRPWNEVPEPNVDPAMHRA